MNSEHVIVALNALDCISVVACVEGAEIEYSVATEAFTDTVKVKFINGVPFVQSTGARYPSLLTSQDQLGEGIIVHHSPTNTLLVQRIEPEETPTIRVRTKQTSTEPSGALARLMSALQPCAKLLCLALALLVITGCAAESKATCSETTPHYSTFLGAVYAPINERKTS